MARAMEAKAEESPPLTEVEVEEAKASREEVKAGKGKRFKTAQEASEWLDAD